jgi:hypothetical protein
LHFLLVLVLGMSCKDLRKLSSYEKRWAIVHPVAAVKAKRLSREIFTVYSEMKSKGIPDSFENGGKLDAFRHSFSMAVLSSKIRANKLRKLGIAHEKGNYRDYLKRRTEEGELPDSLSTVMDLRNNEIGIKVGEESAKAKMNVNEIRNEILNAISKGEMFYMKRDIKGNYLDCRNKSIHLNDYKHTWNIPKCLIATNE